MFDFAASAPLPALQQSPEFAAALTRFGRSPLRLDDGTLALKRGPCLMLSRFQTKVRDLPTLLAGMHLPILLNPDYSAPDLSQIGALPLVSPATCAELDLTGDLRAGLHQKWRNRLKQAERQNLRVTRQNMPIDPRHWLLREDANRQRQRRYRNWPAALTSAFAETNPGKAKLFTAFADKIPIAGLLLLRHGPVATYHVAHTTARGRHHSAQNLLLWTAMTWAARKGGQRLDLGLISTEDAPGLARFKLGTGANPRKLGGTWIWWPPLGKTLRPLAAWDAKLMRDDWTG
ncbi:GNAT family N-acetyltransferase [Tropicibacter sp. R16_0]|uniref:GNAT family N-acetyltransferase n=1 Tax=Tropicibacter sp. R16_0 TaxID=2821102 RepID=UPI001ADCB886|nr:GNAT family N-acetyltransferase [Tropicibacter sp. R16_0]MBO9453197.1 GNAT family N-acetyltransferase [Tropicibacter sp. R16_0]